VQIPEDTWRVDEGRFERTITGMDGLQSFEQKEARAWTCAVVMRQRTMGAEKAHGQWLAWMSVT